MVGKDNETKPTNGKVFYLCLADMETQTKQRHIYSLFEISESIRKVISNAFTGYYWVKAEIVKLNYYPKSGHCYPDLVEKENGKIKAQIRANIWSTHFIKINNKFQAVTGTSLNSGMHVLFLAKVVFHGQYGLSLNILDIEPSFTLGEMAREKQVTIHRLHKEGLFLKNKNLAFPLLPKRVAVISIETSKGYSDFINIIDNNQYNYVFEHKLFSALLQGDSAVRSIKHQLHSIAEHAHLFDVVCIIRGGGGDVGLNAYDSYELAREFALCPLPVIAGIGHSTNETVVQMVAFANKITPTEAGHFLVQQFMNFEGRLLEAEEKLSKLAFEVLKNEQRKVDGLLSLFKNKMVNFMLKNSGDLNVFRKAMEVAVERILTKQNTLVKTASNAINIHTRQKVNTEFVKIDTLFSYLKRSTKTIVQNNRVLLNNQEKRLELLKPETILKRGYSITYHNGLIVKKASQIQEGDTITNQLYQGKITSKVSKINE